MQPHAIPVAQTVDLFGDQVAPPPRSPAERKAFLEGTFRNINAVLQRAEIREMLDAKQHFQRLASDAEPYVNAPQP